MSAYLPEDVVRCECRDPFHDGGMCTRDAADHSPVVASPALCMLCLFGCEDFNGGADAP